ncbi:MAG: glycoside hydrolase family protein [Eubacteriales bacterium]
MDIKPYLTPVKYGKPVLEASGIDGSFDSKAVDCPTLFRHNNSFYMMYVGFDGTGYQTGLARSQDLLNWEKLGCILKRGSNRDWDKIGQAGTWILRDSDLYGSHELLKIDGKYWMFYHSYPDSGYESGPAKIGLAYTEDESLMKWEFAGEPVYTYGGPGEWDGGGLYKCCVILHEDLYYMYYNAKNLIDGMWKEQTGLATSCDMIHWTRHPENPLVRVTPGAWDSVFASDPHMEYDSRRHKWIMFYYGYNGRAAMDGIAVSDDMIHFEKYPVPVIQVGAEGEIDSRYAHKPSVIYHEGKLYHYYCACRPHREGDRSDNGGEFRCISVAYS